jgi:hypothetical protein
MTSYDSGEPVKIAPGVTKRLADCSAGELEAAAALHWQQNVRQRTGDENRADGLDLTITAALSRAAGKRRDKPSQSSGEQAIQ